LKARKAKEAAIVFKEDLVINPNNGWSLTGLAQAQAALGKRSDAAVTSAKARKAFSGNDTIIMQAVF